MSEATRTSDRWAVLIGINGYHESLGRLKYSVNDCRRLAEVLTTGDDPFPADRVLVLADDEPAERRPTYANIHSWLASWLAQPDEDDTVLVFFAGHGREMDGKCYLVPGDATLQTIHVTGIPVPYVQELLNRCKARQKVLILDACHSGAGSRDVSVMAAPMMEALSAGKGIYTLTSCDVDELSHEWNEKKQGVFSYYLAEALSGSCPPDAHGRITAESVYDWVYQRVRHWASGSRCSQHPKRASNASGSIILRQADPDWRSVARDLEQQLVAAQRETTELRARLRNLEEHGRDWSRLRDFARDFVEQQSGHWDHKQWLSFAKSTRAVFPHLQIEDDALGKTLESVAAEWRQRTIQKKRAETLPFRIVLSPANAAATMLLNDEVAPQVMKAGSLPRGKHKITIVPHSCRYGVRNVHITVDEENSRKVIRLRSVCHRRALTAFALLLALGGLLSTAALILPNEPAWGMLRPFTNADAHALGVFFIGALSSILLAIPVSIIVRYVRGLELLAEDPLPIPGHYWLCAAILTIGFCLATAVTYAVSPRLVWAAMWCAVMCVCGVVLCLVPWKPDQYTTRELS